MRAVTVFTSNESPIFGRSFETRLGATVFQGIIFLLRKFLTFAICKNSVKTFLEFSRENQSLTLILKKILKK